MPEKEMTVEIPVDLYYELRAKAEMNSMLMERLGYFSAELNRLELDVSNVNSRMDALENKVK